MLSIIQVHSFGGEGQSQKERNGYPKGAFHGNGRHLR
jgi:hypothetical protein